MHGTANNLKFGELHPWAAASSTQAISSTRLLKVLDLPGTCRMSRGKRQLHDGDEEAPRHPCWKCNDLLGACRMSSVPLNSPLEGHSLQDLASTTPGTIRCCLLFFWDFICLVAGCPTATGSYTIKTGDQLNTIATACGTTAACLQSANPVITNPDLIQLGQTIRVPAACASSPASAPPAASPPSSSGWR